MFTSNVLGQFASLTPNAFLGHRVQAGNMHSVYKTIVNTIPPALSDLSSSLTAPRS
ncbi:hypothetical protein WN55_08008 [Dufourea novaeangliae]|uniref:Uncharacterized protein n=1 Tax=Dufourea novaeangliae TaxID=178035 RepID=A0A154P8Z2_DUFNO|nr:hypothetical protein WN55_08008 [Dufourea novaeangliae]